MVKHILITVMVLVWSAGGETLGVGGSTCPEMETYTYPFYCYIPGTTDYVA